MLFNSIEFLVFLPVAFALYWLIRPGGTRWQNGILLVASCIFYGWWDWRFLLLLGFSIVIDYLAGMAIHSSEKQSVRRTWLWAAVALNLGLLGYFKYFNFFIDSAVRLLQSVGLQANPWSLNVILPIGISFYTFHGLSYVIDIYFRRVRPTKDPLVYSVFVCYFPLLVAGPIERATHLLPQLEKPRTFDYRLGIDGFRLILWGFFKKLVLADKIATPVNEIFGNPSDHDGGTLMLGAVYFAIQVYCDFSGYTDIARGCSRLFGIEVLENFRIPYLSRSIPEFWSRWHISLSTWLNDYVFTPLAIEMRHLGKHGVFLAVLVTFTLSGLWHGPAWHFVAWGMLHGLLYLPHIYRGKRFGSLSTRKDSPLKPSDAPSILLTFALVCIGYVLFRAENMDKAFEYLAGMAKNPFRVDSRYILAEANLIVLLSFLVDWLQRRSFFTNRYSTPFLVSEAVLVTLLIAVMGNFNSEEFIYFQF